MTDEELELFPTSESATKMLSYVTQGFYDKSYVGKWLYQVMGLEYDDMQVLVEELPYQFFPETATWGLKYHEQKWGLPTRENLLYEERRKLIYQKRDYRAPMTPYRMETLLYDLTGLTVHVYDCMEDDRLEPNVFRVEIDPGDSAVDVAAAFAKIKSAKQSHTTFILCYTAELGIEIATSVKKYSIDNILCGTVPDISNGLGMARPGIEVEVETQEYVVEYPMASEEQYTGTVPATSSIMEKSAGSLLSEVTTESYRVSYTLCGSGYDEL